jgi:MFS family permease
MKNLFSYGILITAVCFSIQAVGIGIYVAYGVFFNPIMAEFGWSRAVLSGASSIAMFIMGLFGILVGRLNDRFGPRKLMTGTAVLMGAGLMLTAQTTTVWQLFFFYGVIFGMGTSSVDVIALTTVARWFPLKRGWMTGIVKVGTGAGQFTFPLLATLLIAGYGWRRAFMILGIIALVTLVALAQLLKRDPEDISSPDPKPNRQVSATPATRIRLSDEGISLHAALRTFQLWILCLVNLFLVFGLMVVIVHIVPHARDIGLIPSRAAGVLSTIGAISMAGRLATGFVLDRTGGKRIMIICFILLISDLLWLQAADRFWMLYLFAGIYGIAHGGFYTAISPLVAEIFGTRSHGAIFGIVAFFGTCGGAAGPILAGYIFDVSAGYSIAFWMITGMALIGLTLLSLLKPLVKHQSAP